MYVYDMIYCTIVHRRVWVCVGVCLSNIRYLQSRSESDLLLYIFQFAVFIVNCFCEWYVRFLVTHLFVFSIVCIGQRTGILESLIFSQNTC